MWVFNWPVQIEVIKSKSVDMQTEVIEEGELNSKLLAHQLNSNLLTITWLRSSLPKDTKVTDPFEQTEWRNLIVTSGGVSVSMI